MKAVVIGSGLGGLAAALRLQGMGLDVEVLERRPTVGGRASQLRRDGYTWDTGPSLITMPWVLEQTFAAGGLDLHREVEMSRLDPLYRIYWQEDPRHFDFISDVDELAAQVAQFSARDARQVGPFLDALAPIYRHGILGAGQKAFQDPRALAAILPQLLRLGAVRPLHRFVARFFDDPRVQEVFSFHSLFIGGDPFRVPAIYGALVYLQVLDGGWYTQGGVYSLVSAMARPLDIRTDAEVEAIETVAGRVRGVRLRGGEHVAADLVISNADVLSTQRLLGRRRPTRPLAPTMSCFLLYLGLDRPVDALLHHTLVVGSGYRAFIRAVTRQARMPDTLSLYIHAPTRTEPAMAPVGGDSLAVLLPVPNLRAPIAWDEFSDDLSDVVIRDIERALPGAEITGHLQVAERMTPVDFAREFDAVAGNAFSIEPTLSQSASFRPPNRVRGVQGLYHVGAGTHPGAGIPGVLLGAGVTVGLIAEDLALRPPVRR